MLMDTQAILSNIKIEKELTSSPVIIYCIENQLKQVLINLLKNSIEAMKNGGVIKVSLETNQERCNYKGD
ncbi:hypothetical protein [Litchfieldia alkalitelluris]|uniref:hypothetical protein n=1 Tax=Litchfieldia alkalitelluris TaxID=304268 RepID=UPI001957ADBC|nr:hypothetical protein [Litchfieldia alkalitelluris]